MNENENKSIVNEATEAAVNAVNENVKSHGHNYGMITGIALTTVVVGGAVAYGFYRLVTGHRHHGCDISKSKDNLNVVERDLDQEKDSVEENTEE